MSESPLPDPKPMDFDRALPHVVCGVRACVNTQTGHKKYMQTKFKWLKNSSCFVLVAMSISDILMIANY